MSNRNQGIHGLESGKHWFGNGFTGNNTGGLGIGTRALATVERSTSVTGMTDTVNDTSEELLSDRDVDNSTSTLNSVTCQNITIITENDDTDIVLFQVEGHTAETAGEDNHLSGLDVGKTVDTGDTISDGNDGSGLGVLYSIVFGTSSGRDLSFEVGGELKGLTGHTTSLICDRVASDLESDGGRKQHGEILTEKVSDPKTQEFGIQPK